MIKSDFDVVIIGAGVSGMTAAIYLKRSGVNCCLIEREIPGGQINKASLVKNYPGFTSISGPDLANNIFNQVNELGIAYKYGNVLKIINNKSSKIIKTDIEEITTKKIIIATGRTSKKLGIKGESQLIGKGISYCALCDANFFKDKDIAVIGDSNSAVEESIYLSDICKKVIIISPNERLTCSEELIIKINSINNISIMYQTVLTEFNSKNDKLESITVLKNKEQQELKVEGAFIYIGQIPSSEVFRDIIKFDKNGYIKVNKRLETNIEGIYASGDIVKKDTYQLLTAMNDGVVVAINCIKDLKNSSKGEN